jgi:hypothetical protein
MMFLSLFNRGVNLVKHLRGFIALTVLAALFCSIIAIPQASAASCEQVRKNYHSYKKEVNKGDYDKCLGKKITTEIKHMNDMYKDLNIKSNAVEIHPEGNAAMQKEVKAMQEQLRFVGLMAYDYTVLRIRTFIPFDKSLAGPYVWNFKPGTFYGLFDNRTKYEEASLKIRTEQYILIWRHKKNSSDFNLEVVNFNGKSQGIFKDLKTKKQTKLTGRHSNSGHSVLRKGSKLTASISAGNGLVSPFPKINYNINILVAKDTLTFYGITHGFPAYEIFALSRDRVGYHKIWGTQPDSQTDMLKLIGDNGTMTDIVIPQKKFAMRAM